MFANSSTSSNSSVVVSNAGTGDGLFVTTSNVSNTFPALNITHSGSGSAIRANRLIETAVTTNTGQAGAFAITNASNASSALVADTNGNGSAGNFSITNAGNTAPVLFISHTGTGNAITTARPIQASAFVGDGSGLTNLPGLTLPFLGSSNTASVSFDVTNTNVGSAALFGLSNASNNASVITANSAGTGRGIAINLTNGVNSNAAIDITHSGTGNAITANAPIQATEFIGGGTQLTGVALSTDINIAAATQSVSIGKSVGVSDQGVIIGQNAGASNTVGVGIGNVFVGQNSGSANTSGITNVFAGQNAGSNNDTGNNNVFIGGDAGLVSNGNTNVFVGWNAGANNTSGISNVIIGAGAGTGAVGVPLTNGNNNTLLGTHASVGTDGLTNATAIGFEAIVNANNSIVLGNSSAKVGIGVTSPTAKLEVFNATTSGHATEIRLTEVTSTNTALNVYNDGLGYTAYFRNGNGSATGNAILAENYGLNPTVRSFAYGSGDAGFFSVIGSGTGRGGVFDISNASNSSAALEASTIGTGSAADFNIVNASNASPALDVSTTGTGSAILAASAANGTTIIANHTAGSGNGIDVNVFGTGTGKAGNFTISNTANTAAAVDSYTSGTGNAGTFMVNNVSNSSPAVYSTTSGTGPAIQANQSNNGIAIDITNGTLKYSVVTTGTAAITQRAGVYNLTANNTYTLPSAGVVDGETCLVYDSFVGPNITVEGVSMANGTVRQFIRIGGAWIVVN